jgi:ribose transport system ATP-binding protein
LVDIFTVRENFHLSRTGGIKRAGFLVDHRRERKLARQWLTAVDLHIDPDTPIADLGLGEKSLVAVARLLAQNADVLILDEITAALTRKESEWVLREMRAIAERGPAIIVVSHRQHEIVEHCDRVTIVRDGIVEYSGPTPTLAELHALMEKGHEHQFSYEPLPDIESRPPVLSLRRASGAGAGPVDLEVRSGEVVGLVGSLASRLYSIGHVASGRAKIESGSRELRHRNGTRRRAPHAAFVPEDRRAQGILPLIAVDGNLTISALSRFARWGWITNRAVQADVAVNMKSLNVRPADPSITIDSLSGGNQQKVLMGRAAMEEPDLYVLCEPTRGVDVATRRAIYEFIARVRRSGSAVIVITVDVDDALAVSDRIGVVENGRIIGVWSRNETSATQLLERVS